jgi:LPXTG-motif cell wall-anchored protein
MINSQPAGAEVFIAGKSAGVAPIEQLIEKDTVVELRKEGFIAKTATLTGADKEVTIVLEAAPVPAVPSTAPAAEPGVKASVANDTAPQVAAVTAQEPAVAEKKQGMPWVVIGIAIAAIAGLAFFLIKRKKENQ